MKKAAGWFLFLNFLHWRVCCLRVFLIFRDIFVISFSNFERWVQNVITTSNLIFDASTTTSMLNVATKKWYFLVKLTYILINIISPSHFAIIFGIKRLRTWPKYHWNMYLKRSNKVNKYIIWTKDRECITALRFWAWAPNIAREN